MLKSIKSKVNTNRLKERLKDQNSIEDILFAVATEMMDTYLNNPEITRLLLHCSLESHFLAREVYDLIRTPYVKALTAAIRRLKKRGNIRPVDPDLTAGCFIGMVSECAIGSNLWRDADNRAGKPREKMQNSVPIFARGLTKD